ncbi:MAG: SPOR domain-containing protein, partial [Syntrophaceae bacterium]|nr:SPOR domain-containing protein [Syntrophaceae bacterium]
MQTVPSILDTVMKTRFRTAWAAVLVALFLINSGLLPRGPDLSAHASEPAPPARISVISNALTDTSVVYAVQAAACREESNARSVQLRLQEKGYTPVIHAWRDPSGTLWHSVFLGVFDDAAEARRMADRYQEAERRAPFIKTLHGRVLKPSPDESADRKRDGPRPSARTGVRSSRTEG